MLTHGPVRVVADAAEWMIANGAEVARVQVAAEALARSLGMQDAQCFALPTGVILTLVDGAGFTTTVVRRIHQRNLHLERLSRLEECIRTASREEWSLGEAWLRLKEAASTPSYPFWLSILASGTAASGFALFYGGRLVDAFVAFCLGAFLSVLRALLDRPWIPSVFTTALGAFLGVGGSLLLSRWLPFVSSGPIATGTLMLLVPGLALVNALRDLVAGELVSSQSRMAEVLLTGAAVAIGATAALAVRSGGLFGWS